MGSVFETTTKSGKKILIRYPRKSDAEEMWRYINELSKERTFVRFQGEEVILKEEESYLDAQLKRIENKKSITLLVFFGEELIGISDINLKDKTEKHIGVFGISIAKDYRNEGIGKLLMEKVTEEAKKNMPDLKIITLEVYAKNSIARRVYEGFGFKEYGLLPEGIIREDSYDDAIFMYKKI